MVDISELNVMKPNDRYLGLALADDCSTVTCGPCAVTHITQ